MDCHNIIVMGASAGGVETLSRLLAQLPDDLSATVFIVQHLDASSSGTLVSILNGAGPLPVETAQHGEAFEQGRVYVAPPNHHLLVKPGHLHTSMGPKENHSRPAIDPLFRSAAASYGSCVIGVVLTGMLDDGASGLLAIRRCNGVTVVQNPIDALYSEMPESALAAVNPDHCVPIDIMGEVLVRLTREPAKTSVPVPKDIQLEIKIAEQVMSDIPAENSLGKLVSLTCPTCGGPLWELDEEAVGRYRCNVGHGFTRQTLIKEQNDAIERTLWIALRTLEERAKVQTKLARQEWTRGRQDSAVIYENKAKESHSHVEQIRQLLCQS